MRKAAFALAVVLGCVCAANAQDSGSESLRGISQISAASLHLAAPLSPSSGAFSAPPPTLSLDAPALDANPLPSPRPEPRFVFGSSDDYRWQLAVGYEFVRFRSAAFDANLHGLHTSLTYYTNDWFGIEGSVVATFGPTIFANDRTKYLLYTGGPRIAWRGRKWEPWAHSLFGGMRMIPQIAGGFSQNAFAFQLGGGADFRFIPQLSARFEGDYVRSQLYSTSQNNFQFGTGLVIHF